MKYDKNQLGVFNWVANRITQHAIVEAVAGGGKTTTLVKAVELVPSDLETLYMAFNKHIVVALSARLPDYAKCLTYHSLGFGIIRQALGRVQVDEDKVRKRLNKELDYRQYGNLYAPIQRLVSLCKNNLIAVPDYDLLKDLCQWHELDCNGSEYLVFDTVSDLLRNVDRYTATIDFDDMVFLPSAMHMPSHLYDFIAIDERQDTNNAQANLVYRSIKQNGRILAVGDSRQAIYGWSGADVNAMQSFIDRTHAITLPLSISYRCPRSVVQLVNETFPDIKFEASDFAIDGSVNYIKTAMMQKNLTEGDMILCRTNAPMISYCFDLIRQGKKAIIKGRDIGKNIISFVKKFKTNDVSELINKMCTYQDEEGQRLAQSGKFGLLQQLDDKVQTAIALLDDCATVDVMINKTEAIFSDDKAAITFSSVHKAKGLEAKNVFILHPELMPHPMAKQDWQKVQEQNVKYVAYTRSLENLHIVTE